MKKSLIAFAVLSAMASAASAQSSVVLYGILDTGFQYSTNQNATAGNKSALENNSLSSSRWGFKGSEDLGNGMKANFQLESSLAVDTGVAGNLFDRAATVGVSGSFGKLDAGRQTNLAYDTLSKVDPAGFAFPSTNPNVNLGSMNNAALYTAHGSSNGFSSAARENNSLKFETPAMFGGVTFTGMYGFGEKTGNAEAGSYMGASATYSENGMTAAFSYSQLRDANGVGTLRSYTGGGKFVVNSDLTLKVSYAENEINLTKRNISVAGIGFDYKISPATTLTSAYYANRRSGDTADAKADLFVNIVKYALSPRTTAYASYTFAKVGAVQTKDLDIGMIVGAGGRQSSRAGVGINHAF